jgi:dUTP diphosphatase
VRPGDRIAQLVFASAVRARFEPQAQLDESARGEGGFGSTGT